MKQSHLQRYTFKVRETSVQQVVQSSFRTHQAGFTLLEVLVALLIVGTVLGASLRAIASLTQNSEGLRTTMMANWSAENRLSTIRLAKEWPELGERIFPCPQAQYQFMCQENVMTTPNPSFRRVEVQVFDPSNKDRRFVKLTQVVPNVPR